MYYQRGIEEIIDFVMDRASERMTELSKKHIKYNKRCKNRERLKRK